MPDDEVLADVRVLELANWVAGPSAGAVLADLGADIVKVEPLGGDAMRDKLRKPNRLASPSPALADTDTAFHLDNRGKRSIAVDLGDDRGATLVRRLAVTADVVLTNLLPRRLDRFGLGPDQLRAADPRLVYAIVTAHGTTGEESDRIGFDLTTFFGRGAIMGLMGEPGEPPPGFRPGQGDHPTGLALVAAILAALRVRDRTGQGQVVETSLLRMAAWTNGCELSVALVDRLQPRRRSRREAISPLNTRYRCADDVWISLSAQDQGGWPRFCRSIGRPDLGEDERYATVADRFAHNSELVDELDGVFADRSSSEWAQALDDSGVVWAAAAELPELVEDHQARANGTYVEVEDPRAGRFETVAAPFALSSTPPRVKRGGPSLGEHTRAVLGEAGLGSAEIDDLLAAGVISEGRSAVPEGAVPEGAAPEGAAPEGSGSWA